MGYVDRFEVEARDARDQDEAQQNQVRIRLEEKAKRYDALAAGLGDQAAFVWIYGMVYVYVYVHICIYIFM